MYEKYNYFNRNCFRLPTYNVYSNLIYAFKNLIYLFMHYKYKQGDFYSHLRLVRLRMQNKLNFRSLKKKKLIPAESSFHQPDWLFCCQFFSYSWFAQGWSHSSYKDDFGTTATSKFSGITASCRIFVSGECHFLKNRKFIHVKTR